MQIRKVSVTRLGPASVDFATTETMETGSLSGNSCVTREFEADVKRVGHVCGNLIELPDFVQVAFDESSCLPNTQVEESDPNGLIANPQKAVGVIKKAIRLSINQLEEDQLLVATPPQGLGSEY